MAPIVSMLARAATAATAASRAHPAAAAAAAAASRFRTPRSSNPMLARATAASHSSAAGDGIAARPHSYDPAGFKFDEKDLASDETLWALYERWCKFHGIQRDRGEMSRRFNTFKETADHVHRVNHSHLPYRVALTHLSDLEDEEICCGAKPIRPNEMSTYGRSRTNIDVPIPSSFTTAPTHGNCRRIDNASSSKSGGDSSSPQEPSFSELGERGIRERLEEIKKIPCFRPNEKDVESDEAIWDLYERWCKFHKFERSHDEMIRRFPFFKDNAVYVQSANHKYGLHMFCDERKYY